MVLMQETASETKITEVVEAPPPAATEKVPEKHWDRIIRGFIYALVFLLPILFTPWTFEPLEFSKQMLLFVLTSAAVVAWLLKLLVYRRWHFVKTPLDLPILVLLAVYFLAAIFSVDRVASFLGFYGSFTGNFFQMLFLVMFYYLVVNNFRGTAEIRKLVNVFFFSSFIALLYALLQFFGLFALRLPFAKVESFNTIGSLLTLSIFAAFASVLGLAGAGKSWWSFPDGKIYRVVAIVASFIILLAINFLYAWAALLAGLLLYMVFQAGFSKSTLKDFVTPLVLLIVVIAFLIVQLVFPFLSLRSILNFNLPVEVRLDYTTASPVLKGIITDRPILGSGPNTFLYAFSKHRDQSFNLSPFWNVRFDKAPSEAAEYLVGAGVLGFLAFEILNIIFIVYALYFLTRKEHEAERDLGLVIFSAYIVLWFSHWFFFFNTVVVFGFWLAIAAFMSVSGALGVKEVREFSFSMANSTRQSVSIISAVSLSLVLVVVFLFFGFSVYAADIFYRQGLRLSGNVEALDQAQANLERAIRLNRFRPDYYLTYSEFLFLRINQELTKKDANPGLIQNWLATSINTSRAAVDLSPNNWTSWERLANLYTSARPLVAGVDRFIVESLQRATEHDSKNPVLFTELGQVHRLAARRIDPSILGRGVDSDQDGLSDEQEGALGSGIDNPDTNGNNVLDGNEVLAGLNPAGSGALPDSFLAKYVKTDQESLLQAEKAFRKAIELKGDYVTAYYQLAITLEQAGQNEKAIAEMEQALQKFPGNIALKFEMGRMYFNNNRIEEAARQFQEIVAAVPNHANARFSLALSFERLGRKDRALAEYKKVLELNPESQEIQAKIRQLEQPPR